MSTPPSSRSRDAALRRLARCNRWLLAGSATLTGAFTLLAAQAFPGRTASAATKGTGTRATPPAPATAARRNGRPLDDGLHESPQSGLAGAASRIAVHDDTDDGNGSNPDQPQTEQATPAEATTTAETTTPATRRPWKRRKQPKPKPDPVGVLGIMPRWIELVLLGIEHGGLRGIVSRDDDDDFEDSPREGRLGGARHERGPARRRSRGARDGPGDRRAGAARDRPRLQPLSPGLRPAARERRRGAVRGRGPAVDRGGRRSRCAPPC